MEQLKSLLNELKAQLNVLNKPDRRAFESLKPRGQFGWTKHVYSDSAFQIWHEILSKNPNDLQAAHHLAIMHHARAFDYENERNYEQADKDWQKSLDLWYELCTKEDFWRNLNLGINKDKTSSSLQIRNDWKHRVLAVHFDIAFSPNIKSYRARQHVQLALQSQFSEDVKNQVRLQTYQTATRNLSSNVWDLNTVSMNILEPALDSITNYLHVDEMFTHAIEDLLRVLRKIYVAKIQEYNAHQNEETVQYLISLQQNYSSYLESIMEQMDNLEVSSLENIIYLHKMIANIFSLQDTPGKALSSYEMAMRSAEYLNDTVELNSIRSESLTIRLKKACSEYTDLCNKSPNSVTDEMRASKEQLSQLVNEAEANSNLSEQCLIQLGLVYDMLDEFDKAIHHLTAASALNDDNIKTYYLLSLYHLKLSNTRQAWLNYEEVKRILNTFNEEKRASIEKQFEHLPKDILNRRKEIRRFGGDIAYRLTTKSIAHVGDSEKMRASQMCKMSFEVASSSSRRPDVLKTNITTFCQQMSNLFVDEAYKLLNSDLNVTQIVKLCTKALIINPEDIGAYLIRSQGFLRLNNIQIQSLRLRSNTSIETMFGYEGNNNVINHFSRPNYITNAWSDYNRAKKIATDINHTHYLEELAKLEQILRSYQ